MRRVGHAAFLPEAFTIDVLPNLLSCIRLLVLLRRLSRMFFKCLVKVGDIVKSAAVADLRDGLFVFNQQFDRMAYAQLL